MQKKKRRRQCVNEDLQFGAQPKSFILAFCGAGSHKLIHIWFSAENALFIHINNTEKTYL